MSIQTNFRAEDMLGTTKAAPVKAAPVKAAKAPKAAPAPVVETVVEPVVVVEEVVEAPVSIEEPEVTTEVE